MLTGAVVGAAVATATVVLIAQVASRTGVGVRELFATSTPLRAELGLIVVLLALGLYAIHAFGVVKDGATLELGDDSVRFRRPGIPGFGWWGADVEIPIAEIDRVQVERVRRGTFQRVEVRIGAGRKQIAVNLGHCVADGDEPRARELPRSAWRDQDLVVALAEASECEVALL